MRSVKASHPDYEGLNDLSQKIAWAKNPQLLWEGRDVNTNTAEHKAVVSTLKAEMGKKLQGGLFHDWINERESLKNIQDL